MILSLGKHMNNSYNTRTTLKVGAAQYEIHSLKHLESRFNTINRLPYSLKILLENLLRCEDGVNITQDDIAALANWDPEAEPDREIARSRPFSVRGVSWCYGVASSRCWRA